MKKIFYFIILLLMVGPAACDLGGSCNTKEYFHITNMTLNNVDSHGEPIMDAYWSGYNIQVKFNTVYHSMNNVNFGSSLFAFSCLNDGHMGSDAGLEAMYVVTMTDYNDQYSSEDTLNSIVNVTTSWNELPLSDFVQQSKSAIMHEQFDLQLTEAPADTIAECEFKIIIMLKNGDKFTGRTERIFLSTF